MPKTSPAKVKARRKTNARLQGTTARHLPRTDAEARRLVHELEVHHLELEMQNAELREARSKVETLLQTYTDLYDFAPVGYLSINETGTILEANLAGALLLGMERSLLVNRRFREFVAPNAQAKSELSLKRVFSSGEKQVWTTSLVKTNGMVFPVGIQAVAATSRRDSKEWTRLAIFDLTRARQIEEAKDHLERRTASSRELRTEIAHRQKVEKALLVSESHYSQLLEQSRHLQGQLRHLSRQLLLSQEEERKRISRELHDEILQTLVGINVHLATLIGKEPIRQPELRKKIIRTQTLVTKSVGVIHRFARELRPTVLDDLGLAPALKSFIRDFVARTGLRISFQACPEVARLNGTKRTVLYRVAQAALTNVHKHSKADSVKVILQSAGNLIRMEIEDNGKSFDVERVLQAKRHRRLGLLGSRERVEMVGGIFSVDSESGKGTIVRAEIPV